MSPRRRLERGVVVAVSVVIYLAIPGLGATMVAGQSGSPARGPDRPTSFPIFGAALLGSVGTISMGALVCAVESDSSCSGGSILMLGAPAVAAAAGSSAASSQGFVVRSPRALWGSYLSAMVGAGAGAAVAHALKPEYRARPARGSNDSERHKILGGVVGVLIHALGTTYFVRSSSEREGSASGRMSGASSWIGPDGSLGIAGHIRLW